MSLKKYIESLVIKEAEDFSDAELYGILCETRPEGKVRNVSLYLISHEKTFHSFNTLLTLHFYG